MPKKLTKEEFIKRANEVHEGKYNYDKVEYENNKTKVYIICYEHGEFEQRPSEHLSGRGCPKCKGEANGERKRSSKEDFIKKANEVHKCKYDYHKVKYVNNKTKICIICPYHGDFEQIPKHHLNGCGCPKCANEANGERCRWSKEEFIKKANETHRGKYNYDKVEYNGALTKVCIICPEHGEFWQLPSSHKRDIGCPKCSGCYVPTTEEWIIASNKVHNDKYDYTKVNYVNNSTKVCIICPEHGEFWQTPSNHLQGAGCPKCSGHYILTTEEWVALANEKHKYKYDYSKVNYVKCVDKVCIICPKHGEFEQTPLNHIQGHGCPKCNLSHLERDVMNYLDDMGIAYDYQKHFDWLGKQSLDFYLPDYNVGIECQGGQHFFPVDFANKGVEWACKKFDYTISCDKRKKELCEEHGVKLLYFGNVTTYDTFLGEVVHNDVQYLIDYLEEYKLDENQEK